MYEEFVMGLGFAENSFEQVFRARPHLHVLEVLH